MGQGRGVTLADWDPLSPHPSSWVQELATPPMLLHATALLQTCLEWPLSMGQEGNRGTGLNGQAPPLHSTPVSRAQPGESLDSGMSGSAFRPMTSPPGGFIYLSGTSGLFAWCQAMFQPLWPYCLMESSIPLRRSIWEGSSGPILPEPQVRRQKLKNTCLPFPVESKTNVRPPCTQMSTAALFTRAKRCQQATCQSPDGGINQTWYFHPAEYYSALKSTVFPFGAMNMIGCWTETMIT